MKRFALLALALPALGRAQEPPVATPVAGETRAFITVPASGDARLDVSSPAFANGGDIPFENTMYKGNAFPGLKWSAGPANTKSYVIIMEDVDGRFRGASTPILHWTIGNIPATVTQLAAGMTTPPDGSSYGPNIRGANQPYMGPRTPPGPKHRYHFQVFAMDTVLGSDAFTGYDALIIAMKGHVLASGELVGLGQVMPES